jgi:hypothetical protein
MIANLCSKDCLTNSSLYLYFHFDQLICVRCSNVPRLICLYFFDNFLSELYQNFFCSSSQSNDLSYCKRHMFDHSPLYLQWVSIFYKIIWPDFASFFSFPALQPLVLWFKRIFVNKLRLIYKMF